MGQRSSHFGAKTKLPIFWIFRKQETCNNPEQPVKFQYKTKRKKEKKNKKLGNFIGNNKCGSGLKNDRNVSEVKCRIVRTQNFQRTRSEPNLYGEKGRRYRRSKRVREEWGEGQQFGYEIQDVDDFLSKATLEKPANIPVVLSFPTVLYQTRPGGYQAEISLPLGMVVNAVFKNQQWLYVQTPHAEEGYVSYTSCLPLGIIPPQSDDDLPAPCWEKSTDVFPKPSGNMTDTEKLSLSSKSEYNGSDIYRRRRSRTALSSTYEEQSVDRLYLRAMASTKRAKGTIRETLLVIDSDFVGGKNGLDVTKGEVVILLGTHVDGWFWVRNKNGEEGFIPAGVAGHGFL